MSTGPIQVLLIENDQQVARNLVHELAGCTLTIFHTSQARTLGEARSLLEDTPPDVILLEPDDPGTSIITVLKQLTHGRVPIILLVEDENADSVLDGLKRGAQDVLPRNGYTSALLRRTICFAIERHRMMLQENARNQVFRNVIANIPHFVFWKDHDSIYQGCNQHFADAAGVGSPENIVGKSDHDLVWTTEESDHYRQCDREVMASDTPMLNIEETQLQADGVQRAVLTSKVPLKDAEGGSLGILGIYQDVTEQRELERLLHKRTAALEDTNAQLLASQGQLVHSEKMASIGQLAAGVAHDINNPVGFVISNLNTLTFYLKTVGAALKMHQALCDCLKADRLDQVAALLADIDTFDLEEDLAFVLDDAAQLLAESLDGADRIKGIVQNLRNFARHDESDVAEADLNHGLQSTLKMVWNELKNHCTVNEEYGDIPLLRYHPGQLNQVFMNLLINAGQAIQGEGTVTIKSWLEDENICVSVADTGCGIPAEQQTKIFDPFFTTKPVGKGTGLGLSVSYGIVQAHGGNIEVSSEVGKGSTFTVVLPLNGLAEVQEDQAEAQEDAAEALKPVH
jgi:PAS domain S-box-containing protein